MTDNRTPQEIAYDRTALSTRTPAQPTEPAPLSFDAYVAEVYRRLGDPNREPFVLAKPLTPEEVQQTVGAWQQLAYPDRWLEVFERIADMPESEQNRTLDMLDTALEVLEEYDVEPPA
jgi:hypothetical protein